MKGNKDAKAEGESLFSFGSDAAPAPGQQEATAIHGGQQEGSLFSDGKHKPKKGELGPEYGYEKKLFRSKDEVSVYTQQMDERYAMDKRKRAIIILGVAVILLVPLMTIAPTGWLTQEGMRNGLVGWFDILQSNLNAVGNLVSGTEDGNGIAIVFWQTLACVLVGAALALNGTVYQGALKNALASPSTLGVMSGGTLGTLIYTLTVVTDNAQQSAANFGVTATKASDLINTLDAMSLPEYILATQERAIFSVIGCLVIVGLVLGIAYIAGKGKVSKSALVIAGQVFAAVITGIVSVVRTYITYYGDEAQLEALRTTVGGSISGIMGPVQFCLVAIPLVIGFIVIMALRGRINLLAFNDEEARSMGISVGKTRVAVIAVCTIMTAVVVSFCGSIGFVGFLIPHAARKLVGPDLRYLIPASALLGAVYVLVANHIMALGALLNGSLGTFTSLIGIVFFIAAIIVQRRRGNADWI